MDILADTALVKMVQNIPHEQGQPTLTHHLRPSDLIKLIHKHNRSRWGRMFYAYKEQIEEFWTGLFSQPDGQDFKQLHPILRGKTPEQLRTTIPIIVHEDAAPYGKKRSVQLLQWGPLLYQGSDIESRFVAHGSIAKEGDTADTAWTGWELFFEDIDHLAEGNDQDGNPVAQYVDGTKWKFVFTFDQNDFDMDYEHGLSQL